jgi:hypothetical protein
MAYALGESSTCYDFPIQREDVEGIIMLSCDKIPEMFAAVMTEEEIRPAIDTCLKNALGRDGVKIQVFTNGRLDVPVIAAVVKASEV